MGMEEEQTETSVFKPPEMGDEEIGAAESEAVNGAIGRPCALSVSFGGLTAGTTKPPDHPCAWWWAL